VSVSRICTTCKRELPLEAFGHQKQGKYGLKSWCKECCRQKRRAHYVANRVRANQLNRAWISRNLGKVHRMQRGVRLKRLCGVTLEQFETVFNAQGRRCAVCGSDSPRGKGWHADHDHKTGAFRGVLCGRCNPGLGLFGDSPEMLRLAADYLEKSSHWVKGNVKWAATKLPTCLYSAETSGQEQFLRELVGAKG